MECAESLFIEEFFNSDLFPRLIANGVDIVGIHFVIFVVFSHLGVDFVLGHGIYELNNIAYAVMVYLPTEFDLSLDFIAVCNGNITHIIGYTQNAELS